MKGIGSIHAHNIVFLKYSVHDRFHLKNEYISKPESLFFEEAVSGIAFYSLYLQRKLDTKQ